MIWLRLNLDFTSRLIEKPLIHRDDVSGRAVDDLPPALRIIQGVDLQLLGMKALHETDPKGLAPRRHPITDQVLLLDLLRMCTRPRIVITRGVVGRILLRRIIQKRIRHLRTIAVAQCIGT